jgi:hypothetical protein
MLEITSSILMTSINGMKSKRVWHNDLKDAGATPQVRTTVDSLYERKVLVVERA